MRRSTTVIGLCAALSTTSAAAVADEGQWPPQDLVALAPQMRAAGLGLDSEALWNESGGLMRAVVNLNGCSAAFVSRDGLIATNHHCAYGALQNASSPEKNYLHDGFVARDRTAELPALGARVQIIERIDDVSQEVLAAAATSDDLERYRAVERKQKEIVARCEEQAAGQRCYVKAFYAGSVYRLFRVTELTDVRIVYAPPASVGEYGGEIDNWMWPRHTGDFTLLRAYVSPSGAARDHHVDNVPHRPRVHLPVSPHGVRPGSFVAVMGYPGHTNRYLPAAAIERHVEQELPARIQLFDAWKQILAAEGTRSPDVALKVAAKEKSLANREKNARGMLAGIRRMDLLERRRERDRALASWAAGGPHAGVLPALQALEERRQNAYLRELVLSSIKYGASLLPIAIDLVRRESERWKPDLDRHPLFMEREADTLRKLQTRRLKSFDPGVEARILASLVVASEELDIPAFAAIRASAAERGTTIDEEAARIVRVSDIAERLDELLAAQTVDVVGDLMLSLAAGLMPTIEAVEAEQDAIAGAALAVEPRYIDMLRAHGGGNVLYPDANGTLRLSFARVQGYAPRDGLIATPQTTLTGMLDKHTGATPFALPQRLLYAAEREGEDRSYWQDPRLGDVPICFLSNADTTGGNSGSPVIDGAGRLVGLNFDRVWENIAGDFAYNPPLSRNVIVDVRYLAWMLDRVDGAEHLLAELGLADYRDAPPRFADERPPPPPASKPISGCHVSGAGGRDDDSWLWLVALAALAARRRSPRRQ